MKYGANTSKWVRRLALASALLALTLTPSAFAQGLIPADFFNASIDPAAPTAVDADTLTFDSVANVITATGSVVLRQGGYTMAGQSLVYNRVSGELKFVGEVTVLDPSGNLAEMDDLEVTGGMKQAFMNALTITAYDGSRITADSVDYDDELLTVLERANYAPCGECVDGAGQRIGWSVQTSRVIKNGEDGSITLEQPTLSLLGIPVAWLPYLWLPDTGASTLGSLRMPNYDYSEQTGHRLEVPYYAYSSRWTDVILTPTFMTRQGFLLGAEVLQRFDAGSFQIKASGLYQWDKAAFTFTEAQRDWRGAIQTSGEFKPIKDWTVGWSYTAFTDAAYLVDYRLAVGKSTTNQVYATHLTDDTYFDARVQQFNQIGNYTAADQGQQAQTVPVVQFNHVEDLGPGNGRVEIAGKLLGVRREFDSKTTSNGVPYVFGYAGNKQHASLQAGWQTQWIGAGGFVATPYLGGRADLAYYDGTSPILPGATTLWSATPIAAMDVRFPMAASDGSTVHLIEPIGQLVYRGSNTSAVGITNDDAQSFVFDDTNLFSYNRFSGSARQETGLRANVGGRYQANFLEGSFLELIAGQSFQLAGSNAFAGSDHTQVGVGSGLDTSASYAVLGAYAGLTQGITAGGKLQIDTTNPRISRGSLTAAYSKDRYGASLDYSYIAANRAAGVIKDQHEIGGTLTVPVTEYWSVNSSAAWDLSAGSFLQVGGGVVYDDGYLLIGAGATRNGPTHTTPNATNLTASFRLKAPAGLNLGYTGSTALPTLP
ncbi:LPS-assembly protein LptD [Devosia psychrophila]|uniref:LPS-assembly protein LptD n=1 Tax=Devosia psychrophila TaxID=728005 RepID=A0A1I1NU59_9HYPH|nr:LPS assembly protein LptD [Devosia psychrophila]SFD01191.1 LPS-assembly protein [Devosia psychrophila]